VTVWVDVIFPPGGAAWHVHHAVPASRGIRRLRSPDASRTVKRRVPLVWLRGSCCSWRLQRRQRDRARQNSIRPG